jgi:hypothetical protein
MWVYVIHNSFEQKYVKHKVPIIKQNMNIIAIC